MAVLCLTGTAAFAQWAEPELPTAKSTAIELGHKYQINNRDNEERYIGEGTPGSHSGGAAMMVERDEAITFVIDYAEDDNGTGYTFVDSSTGLYTYLYASGRNYDHLGWGVLHLDASAGTVYTYFEIETNGDATFCIKTPYYDSTDANGNDTTFSGYWGYAWNNEEYPEMCWGMLDKTDGDNHCYWQLIDVTVYDERCELYDALVKSTEYPDIDQSVIDAATAVYNNANATIDELEEQINKVNAAIIEATLGDGDPNGPTDATSLLENPDFSAGDISGWNCTFVSGTSATNVGYNDYNPCENTSYTYINHEGVETYPFVDDYIEAWSASGAQYGSTEVSRSIGDAELSQTVRGLPAGTWLLSCDAIAVQQSSSYQDHNPVSGVQLFATGDNWDMYKEIATGDGVPEHCTLTFASDGGTVTLGLRTKTTDANWIAADNFELLYYGDDGTSPYYLALQVAVEDAEKYYTADAIDEVIAGAEQKAAYLSALETAKALLENSSSSDTSKNEEFISAADTLTSALTALQTSETKYASVASLIDYINEVSDKAQSYGWTELLDELADIRDNLEAGYLSGTLTDEQIDSVEDDVTNAIADYISEYVQPGDDITMVITNPNFDTSVSGWTVSGTTPTFGGEGTTGGGSNTIDGGIQPSDLGGDAEVYHATFDISQTIKNMPEGLYTLSCSGFARDDDGDGIQAELYASVNDAEQTQTLVSLYSEGSSEMLYNSSSFPDVTATLNNGDVAYVPDGMAGANIYFYLGYYQNKFNILVEERGDLTIGVRETSTDDWVIFDTFQLVYQGNDASVYVEVIEELIEQAMEVQESGLMSNEADQRITNAINEGYDALDLVPADKDVSMAAVQSLRNAIEAGETSINLILDLEYLVDYTNDTRLSELSSSINDEILDVIEEVFDALDGDGFETDADVQGYMYLLKGTYNKCAMYDHLDATEDSPADVSDVILTRDCVDTNGENSHYGWTPTSDSVITGERHGLMEIFSMVSGSGIEQVLYNLYAGWYRLGVQAFYRPGSTYSTTCPIGMTEEENDTIHLADLYAGSKATRVVSIFSDAEEYSEIEGTTTSTTYTIPNTMTESGYAFDDDLYHNYLQFQVEKDGTDVPIGLVKTGYVSGDWLIWSHWTLEYVGSTEPTVDPTTAIESIDGSGSVLATAIYSINGVQQNHLTKGVNIVKETLSDGTVKVSKVLRK